MCNIQIDTFRYQIFTVIDHALALSITGLFKYCIVLERSLHFVFAVDVIRELIIERHYWIVKRKSNSNQSIDTSTRITMTTSRRRLVLAAVCSGGDNKWYICLVLCWAPHRGPGPGPGVGILYKIYIVSVGEHEAMISSRIILVSLLSNETVSTIKCTLPCTHFKWKDRSTFSFHETLIRSAAAVCDFNIDIICQGVKHSASLCRWIVNW